MTHRILASCLVLIVGWGLMAGANAAVYRWDRRVTIPGTEGISLGPGVQLDHLDLGYASMSRRDLTGANFEHSAFMHARLDSSNLSDANLTGANLNWTDLSDSNLAGAILIEADLSHADLAASVLANSNLTGAVVFNTQFHDTTRLGFTREQLYSTASYQANDLRGIVLGDDLSGWDFGGKNLSGASLGPILTGANFAEANVRGTSFGQLTTDQLYSTMSYKERDLRGIGLGFTDLTGWDFHRQDLTNATFYDAVLSDANLSASIISGASFVGSETFTKEQLYSTASYAEKNLRGIRFGCSGQHRSQPCNDLSGWDFSGQDLTGARFNFFLHFGLPDPGVTSKVVFSGVNLEDAYIAADLTNVDLGGSNLTRANFALSTLTGANFEDSVVRGAAFTSYRGFSKEQLYATSSYQAKDLREISIQGNLSGWDFGRQNLANAGLSGDLSAAILSDANLVGTAFDNSNLTHANFSGAQIIGASFRSTTDDGFTKEQFYSTASYQKDDLRGIELGDNDLSGWDFSDKNLSGASLHRANLTGTTFTGATIRDANIGAANGFTKEQLSSTASYQARDLRGVGLYGNDLVGWDFSDQNLRGAVLGDSRLDAASFVNADLTLAGLGSANLTNANLQGANLTSAYLERSVFTNANLGGANLKNAMLVFARALDSAQFNSSTVYNQWTVFPIGFDPVDAGLSYKPSPRGDFNADEIVDVADVELLSARIGGLPHPPWWLRDNMFDLNRDSTVDHRDLDLWLHDLKQTWLGDVNLDGEFNSADLVVVLALGKYETSDVDEYGELIDPISWSEGDWNADGEFTSADLIAALADGGYEQGPRPAAVPEPSGVALALVAAVALASRRVAWPQISS